MKTKKVRPVLVPQSKAIWPDCIWLGRISRQLRLDTSYNDNPKSIDPIDDSMLPQELILISLEDEKIEIGDILLDSDLKTSFEIFFPYEDGDIAIDKFYKIIARQSQLSPELIQQLVDEYNNGGMKDFEIEMDFVLGDKEDENQNLIPELKPKLTGGFITVVKEEYSYNLLCNMQYYMEYCQSNGYVTPQEWLKNFKHYSDRKEPILYTEEEVKLLFENWLTTKVNEELMRISGEIDVLDGVDFYEWFERNKKK